MKSLWLLQCGYSNHERYGFIFTLFVFFSLILIFFSELANHSRESMQRPRLFFLSFFHIIFKVVPWIQTTAETFFPYFFDFLSIMVVPLLHNSGIFYKWNYNTAFWWKYYYFLIQKQGTMSLMSHSPSMFNCNTHVFPPLWL